MPVSIMRRRSIGSHASEKGTKRDCSIVRYGQALVYLDSKKLDKARTDSIKLITSDPTNLFYLDAISDLHRAEEAWACH